MIRQVLARTAVAAAGMAAAAAFAGTAQASETITYTYDAQGRVIVVKHDGGPNDDVERTYEYDDADNRTKKTTTGA